jgi:hypothetical protein
VKLRTALGLAVAFALAAAAVASAAPVTYKVTGGGQTFASSQVENGKPTVKGPGDTITFQAFIPTTGQSDASTGSVNIIDRTAGAGGKGVHYRGTITCTYLVTDGTGGGYAELQGTGQTNSGTTTPFVVRIRDNGQGAGAEADLVEFDRNASTPDCSQDNSDQEFEFTLARGNAKIHKASTASTGAGSASSATTLGAPLRLLP